jgi:transcriptional regulator with XRE-family HTH domain
MTKVNEPLRSLAQEEEVGYDDIFHETVSHYLNVNRKRQKVTQQQIAERLKVSQSAVCQMLKRPATIGKLWRLCRALGGELEVNIRFGDKTYSLLNEPLPNDPDAWMYAKQ